MRAGAVSAGGGCAMGCAMGSATGSAAVLGTDARIREVLPTSSKGSGNGTEAQCAAMGSGEPWLCKQRWVLHSFWSSRGRFWDCHGGLLRSPCAEAVTEGYVKVLSGVIKKEAQNKRVKLSSAIVGVLVSSYPEYCSCSDNSKRIE